MFFFGAILHTIDNIIVMNEVFMLNPQKIEQVIQQVQNALPQGMKDLGKDAEAKFKQVLQAQLAKLDVVTREEFEVQTQVLMRTREKLTELEKRLDTLLAQKTD
ncbi:Uncharacterized protein conserved in bacteria [Avibacterium paragallinarum]|uniref:Ubiquinone biosynthesis accessory factor UbiK n=2 Tax=Avibacterium paragallinarum TaxID=728 RepID=A0A380X663_AVIPA|nr:Uncharacterized protein conserved in bacteria [Avibacterium paragallinarum]